jgi:hypothetical protein
VNPTVETLIIPILPSGLRMRPSTDWRGTWKGRLLRAWAFGPSRLALVIGILFVLLSLVLPFWTLAERTSSTLEIHSFSWRTFVTERFEDGTWSETTIFPYTSGGFPYPTVAGVAGNVYILSVVYLAILVIMLALFQMGFSRTLPTLSLLFISLIVLTGALFALFYPLVAIPTAATTDARYFAIGGFWGTALEGGTAWSWGPGLGWWLLLIGVVSGIVGVVLPYLKSLRSMALTEPGTVPRLP